MSEPYKRPNNSDLLFMVLGKIIFMEKYFKLPKMFEESKEALGKLSVDIKEELTAETRKVTNRIQIF